ncbi:MAG: hypothetical protein KBI32_14960, partial [Phycisphaerae bacterium]|nr:hypothetical protein [Phycisphaerae bacterium]
MRIVGGHRVRMLTVVVLSLAGAFASAQTTGGNVAADLMTRVPADFPRFEFADHAEQADLLTHYLWYHFHHRLGNGLTLFNQEYLLTSDIWLGNARPRGSDKTIQEVHRSMLLGMQMDDEGYVLTHQHFS